MPTLIKGGRVVADDWMFVEATPDDGAMARIILPIEYALAHIEGLQRGGREIGVCLPGDAEPDQILPLLPHISLIAIQFAAFNDGRGLSLAVLLRSRHGFRGELRAIGEVHEDVLHYMHRCGFDSFQLPDGRDPTIALKALNSLTDFYQGSVKDPLPAFRRVTRGTARAQ
jgi:uncharacterized protein (DUF934 family)